MKKISYLLPVLASSPLLPQNNYVAKTPSAKKIFTFIFSIAFFCCIKTTVAQGIYLEIPTSLAGFPSSSSATVEVALNSVQFGVSATIPVGAGSGSDYSPSRPSYSDMTVTKGVDISSIALQRSIATASAPISVLKINFYRAGTGGTRELAYQYVLEECFFTSYSASSSEGCSGGCAGISETVSIIYRKISVIDSSQQGTPRQFRYNIPADQEF